jgi:putrescine aminotransferase
MSFTPHSTREWQDLDAAHYMHPFTGHAELHQSGSRVIVRAEGAYLWDSDGNKILDGLSGLGNVNIGYGRRELASAAAAQMQELSYCQSFFKSTNPAAVSIATTLAELVPSGLNHVFLQSSGSEANETAIRAVRRYWELAGQPQRRKIIARELAYHGSTVMTASLSGLPLMHAAGGDLPLPNIVHIKPPYQYRTAPGMSAEEFGVVSAGWLEEAIIAQGVDTVAAFIAEPMQAGAAILPPATYWAEIQRICRKYDVLLIVDEVVAGFGRTGSWFGCDTYGITPDILVVGKAITSGYIPLSATLLSDRIANTLIERGGVWSHGFTYSGHPVCCAVANENIRIMRSEGLVESAARDIAPYFKAQMEALADHPLVGDVRVGGLLGGFELVKNRATREGFPDAARVAERCSAEAWRRGLVLRANRNTMSLMPMLIMTRDQLDFAFAVIRESLDATRDSFSAH